MRPIIEAFWCVEYADGYVAQFDNGIEHRYAEVDHKKAVRYWWLPVPPQMTIPGTRHNPLLKRHCVEPHGAQGFVCRRVRITLGERMGRLGETPIERAKRLLTRPPVIECYVLGIEGGPRVEIYPDGTVLQLKEPRTNGETQGVLR